MMMSPHIHRCLLFLLAWVSQAQGQGADKYYSGSSTAIGSSQCPITNCINAPSPCQPFQFRSGCVFNSSGTCLACSLPSRTTSEYYNNAAQKLTNNCDKSICPACSAGQRNDGCSASSAGTCVACSPTSPTAGNYYTTPVNAAAQCVTATCASVTPSCSQTERRVGCGGNSSGTCSACTSLPAGHYWSHALNSDTCTSTAFTVPDAGQYYPSKGPAGMGSITSCPTGPTTPTSNFSIYFITPTALTADCATAPKTICPAGKQNTGSSTTLAGVCTADCTGLLAGKYWIANTAWNVCTSADCVDTDCQIGQWKSGCTGTNSGTCANCTTANATQVYSTKGGWNNLCQVVNCEKSCGLGQYVGGCGVAGATSGSLTCLPCTNAPLNSKYWTDRGAYTPTSCATRDCEACPNGNWRNGCGGINPGVCTNCDNV